MKNDPQEMLKETLGFIITEIGAGCVLFPKSKEDETWNNASQRAIRICSNYRNGDGLFQIINPKAKNEQKIS